MGKKRWQSRPEGTPPQPASSRVSSGSPAPAPAGTKGAAPAPRGRWRQRAGAGQDSVTNPPNRQRARLLAAVSALVLVLVGLVALVFYVSPVPAPKLVVLTARYRNDLLPPNGMAVQDAAVLTAQGDVLDTGGAEPQSLDSKDLEAAIGGLPNTTAKYTWFSREPSTLLVYVNLLGVSVYEPENNRSRAFLLPDDFEVGRQVNRPGHEERKVPVSDLLKALLEAQADQKLLVLDCQRMDHFWPLGMVANHFVEDVKAELEELKRIEPDRTAGLAVLFSSGGGEVTWVDANERQSVFGYYFARGLAGAADTPAEGGDGNRRITLAELERYLATKVAAWVSRNRADGQTPFAWTAGRAAEYFTILPGARDPLPEAAPRQGAADGIDKGAWDDYHELAPGDFTVETARQELQAAWEKAYKLRSDKLPPWRYAPELWRSIEDMLLRSEAFVRGGDLAGAREELRGLDSPWKAIEKARKDYTLGGTPYSLALARLFDKKDPGYGRLLSDLLEGGSFADTVNQFKNGKELRQTNMPIEAHLVRMLHDHLLAAPFVALKESEREPVEAAARNRVKVRVLAENAAAPNLKTGMDLVPSVFRWTAGRIDEADRLRRFREDELFATENPRVDLGGGAPSATENADAELYDQAIERANEVATILATEQLLLAEAPHVARRLAQRPWTQQDQSHAEKVRELGSTLLRGLGSLSAQLRRDPTAPGAVPDAGAAIEAMRKQAEDLAKTRQLFVDELANEARSLGENYRSPDTQITWHRVNDVLAVAFPADSNPEKAATIRGNLVRAALESVSQLGGESSQGPASTGETLAKIGSLEQSKYYENSARLALDLYALGTGAAEPLATENLGLAGFQVGKAWRALDHLAVEQALDPANGYVPLARADAAGRILDGFAAQRRQTARMLRRFDASTYLGWQAGRFTEDFWAGSEGDKESYFSRAAHACLSDAKTAALGVRSSAKGSSDKDSAAKDSAAPTDKGDFAPWLVGHFERLREVERLADQLELKPEASEIKFREGNEQNVRLVVEAPPGYPRGSATVRRRLEDAPSVRADFERRSDPSSPDVALTLTRDETKPGGAGARLELELLFRGHARRPSLPIELVDYDLGPTIVYRMGRLNDGQISVHVDKQRQNQRTILFVLDCSGSMSEQGRMNDMKQALNDLADEIDEGDLWIGIRLLGHKVPYVGRPPPANLKSQSMVDTKLEFEFESFNRENFKRFVNSLKPVGSTPLYEAIRQAHADLESQPGNEKAILVISDGQDTFLEDPKYTSNDEILKKLYAGSGIQINAIGYKFDNGAGGGAGAIPFQLKNIVAVGREGGKPVLAEDRDKLLRDIVELAGFFNWQAVGHERSYPKDPKRLEVRKSPVPVPAGIYTVAVTDTRREPIAKRDGVRVERGELHDFSLRGREIQYEANDFPRAIARDDDDASRIALRVLAATPVGPNSAGGGAGLELLVALFRRDELGEQRSPWRPAGVSFTIQPKGRDARYTLQNLAWNEPGHHLPVWRFTIEDWPTGVTEADLEARWDEQPSKSYSLAWSDYKEHGTAGKFPEGIKLTQWTVGPWTDGTERIPNATKVLFVFPDGTKDLQDWSVGFGDQEVKLAREVYNTEADTFLGQFVLMGEQEPRTLVLHPPRQGPSLKTTFSVTGKSLKDNARVKN